MPCARQLVVELPARGLIIRGGTDLGSVFESMVGRIFGSILERMVVN